MYSEGNAQGCLHLAILQQKLGRFTTTLLYEVTDCDKDYI